MIFILPATLLLLWLLVVATTKPPTQSAFPGGRLRSRGNTDMFPPALVQPADSQTRLDEETWERRMAAALLLRETLWTAAAKEPCVCRAPLRMAVAAHPGYAEAVLGSPFG